MIGCTYKEEDKNDFSSVNDLTLDGFLWINLDQYNNAMESFSRAIDLDKKYSLAWSGKGVCSYRLNKLEDAIYFFDKASQLEPENKKIKKIVEILNKMI